MKVCELYEDDFGALGTRGKKETFFLFFAVQRVDSGSFFYTMFINSVMRMVLGCFMRPVAVLMARFMNFVKNYEVRVCNVFFGIGLSVEADFMNMKKGQTSQMFIKGKECNMRNYFPPRVLFWIAIGAIVVDMILLLVIKLCS